MRLAHPTRRQLAIVDHFQRMRPAHSQRIGGNRIHPLARPVRRAVVNRDDLQAHAR
jgi:hypothetical protein